MRSTTLTVSNGTYDISDALARAQAGFQVGKLADGRTVIMVHYVIAEVDRGKPIQENGKRRSRGS